MKNLNEIYSNSNLKKPNNKRIRFKEDEMHQSTMSNLDMSYSKRLLLIHAILGTILFISCLFHLISICTNDWYYLNTNLNNNQINYAKGGLWNYCSSTFSSLSSLSYVYNNGILPQSSQSQTCMSYEQYQTQMGSSQFSGDTRLASSRILIVFTFVLNVLILILFEIAASVAIFLLSRVTSNTTLTTKKYSRNFLWPYSCCCLNKKYPKVSYVYLNLCLLGLLFSFVSIVLLLTGFGLFESFIEFIGRSTNGSNNNSSSFWLSRGFSYWLIVTAIALLLTYFFVKLWCLFHVIKLTTNLISINKTFIRQQPLRSSETSNNQPTLINMNYNIDTPTRCKNFIFCFVIHFVKTNLVFII